MYECRCCGISKHIYLKEDRHVLLEIFDVCLGMRLLIKPDWGIRDDSDSSNALSDQASSLDIVVAERYSVEDEYLVHRPC